MKLKEFIDKLSLLDENLDVAIYTEDEYEGYRYFDDPIFSGESKLITKCNLVVENYTLFIGGSSCG